jgi:hypothetical protein
MARDNNRFKESAMPDHRQAPEAVNQQAVRATIQRIKAEITSHPDPETLNEIRAAFRREIPLHLRSYAAALLILEASGSARSGRRNDGRQAGQAEGRRDKGNGRQSDERKKEGRKNDGRQADGRRADGRKNEGRTEGRAEGGEQKAQQPRGPEMPSEETRPRFRGEGTTVFFGMGKRQRLYPRVLLRILTEEGGLSFEEIGDIRSFDNYSFADLDPLCADGLIATLDGKPFRGRGLPVSKARKRGAAGDEEAPRTDSGLDASDEGLGTEGDGDFGSMEPGLDKERPLDADESLADESLDEADETDEDSGFDEGSDEDLPEEDEEGDEKDPNAFS